MKLNMLAAGIEQERFYKAQRQITRAQITQYYDENRQRLSYRNSDL